MSTKRTLTLTPYQRTVIISALAVAGHECPLLATLIETAGPVAITLYSKDLQRTTLTDGLSKAVFQATRK